MHIKIILMIPKVKIAQREQERQHSMYGICLAWGHAGSMNPGFLYGIQTTTRSDAPSAEPGVFTEHHWVWYRNKRTAQRGLR